MKAIHGNTCALIDGVSEWVSEWVINKENKYSKWVSEHVIDWVTVLVNG